MEVFASGSVESRRDPSSDPFGATFSRKGRREIRGGFVGCSGPVALGVPHRRINKIVLGERAVTADTDLRLARYWGLSEGFFLRLQSSYDLLMQSRKIGATLAEIRPRAA